MRKKWNASLTVEAAFLVPIVIGILVFLIEAALYCRDLAVAKAVLTKEVSQGTAFMDYDVYPGTDYVLYERLLAEGFFSRLLDKETEEVEQILALRLQQELSSAFLFADAQEVQVKADGSRLTMSFKLNGQRSLLDLGGMGGDFFCREVRVSETCTDASMWNRIVTLVLRTGERISGVSEVMQKIEEFFSWLGK